MAPRSLSTTACSRYRTRESRLNASCDDALRVSDRFVADNHYPVNLHVPKLISNIFWYEIIFPSYIYDIHIESGCATWNKALVDIKQELVSSIFLKMVFKTGMAFD